jgi:hypothetical protein
LLASWGSSSTGLPGTKINKVDPPTLEQVAAEIRRANADSG